MLRLILMYYVGLYGLMNQPDKDWQLLLSEISDDSPELGNQKSKLNRIKILTSTCFVGWGLNLRLIESCFDALSDFYRTAINFFIGQQ